MTSSKQFTRRRLVSCLFPMLVLLVSGCSLHRNKPFSVILLPDTQNYSEKFPDTYLSQTQWIRDSAEDLNTRFVIHLGDIVQTASHEHEWKLADRAHRILDDAVPYSLTVGNHDMEHDGDRLSRKTTLYEKYFPPSRFEEHDWYGPHMGDSNVNNACFFEAAGMKFMVLSLEFAPSRETLQWADEIVNAHKDKGVILATHYYMRPEGRPDDKRPYGLDGLGPEELFQSFVRKHNNIFMVVSGHVLGVHHQTSLNDAGQPVHEILCDYQGEANGGDGWLQILRFVPKEETIYVQCYSPTLDGERPHPRHSYPLPFSRKRLSDK